jgi:hypothetical protein
VESFVRSHLSDSTLRETARGHAAVCRTNTAHLLADIAEIEARKLHLRDGHGSMFAYCVEEFRLSSDEAIRRLRAARLARRFPILFPMLADGRMNLTGVLLLRKHLRRSNACELIDEAIGKSKSEIEHMLARRFPRTTGPTWLRPMVPVPSAVAGHKAGESEVTGFPIASSEADSPRLAATPSDIAASGELLAPAPLYESVHATAPPHGSLSSLPASEDTWARLTPVAPALYELRATVSLETSELLQRLRDLLSHQISSGNLAAVLHRALEIAAVVVEKGRVAARNQEGPGAMERGEAHPTDGRHIPSAIRRAVWRRDQGRCAYEGPDGRRCDSRWQLELDHVQPFALGGKCSIGNLRLLCRAHNQLLADVKLGEAFMAHKRQGGG